MVHAHKIIRQCCHITLHELLCHKILIVTASLFTNSSLKLTFFLIHYFSCMTTSYYDLSPPLLPRLPPFPPHDPEIRPRRNPVAMEATATLTRARLTSLSTTVRVALMGVLTPSTNGVKTCTNNIIIKLHGHENNTQDPRTTNNQTNKHEQRSVMGKRQKAIL
jgi:hypothetical protein